MGSDRADCLTARTVRPRGDPITRTGRSREMPIRNEITRASAGVVLRRSPRRDTVLAERGNHRKQYRLTTADGPIVRTTSDWARGLVTKKEAQPSRVGRHWR